MSEEGPGRYDIVIAGGGMVGLVQALTLSRLSAGRLRVLVAEGHAVAAVADGTRPPHRPSFDGRSSALSYGSSVILERLGIWSALTPHLTPITDIHVSERGGFGHTHLQARERGWPALGYVVENAWLGQMLLAAVRACRNIEFWSPAEVTAFQPGTSTATVTVMRHGQPSTVECGLLAVATGADSGLLSQLGIQHQIRDYQQQAMVTNVACQQPHNGWAYERFTDWGPMALLPLTDAPNPTEAPRRSAAGRMALIWTMPPERAQHLLGANDGLFLQTLQQRYGHRQGNFMQVGQRHTYPLRLLRATEQVRHQLVLIGNAAHSLHPVAGQGFNLALRDVQRLAEVLWSAQLGGERIGDNVVLQRYCDRQSVDQWRTILFSDRIGGLFERPDAVLGHLRRLGLFALDLMPAAKQLFVNHSAGYHPGAALGLNA